MSDQERDELYTSITRVVEASDQIYHLWKEAWKDRIGTEAQEVDPPSCVKYSERRDELVRIMKKLYTET